jgi:dienelactone hydrolase
MITRCSRLAGFCGAAVLLLGIAINPSLADEPMVLRDALIIPGVTAGGRTPMPVDHIAHALASGGLGASAGPWRVGVVREGDTLVLPDGATRTWSSVAADDAGAFTPDRLGPAARGGYVLCRITSEREQVRVLEASGHALVFVNGEPRVGDPYAHGYVRVPVLLKKGENTLLFRMAGRGAFRARLVEPTGLIEVNTADLTLPDVIRPLAADASAARGDGPAPAGNERDVHLGLTMLNTSPAWVTLSGPGLDAPVLLPPTGVVKVPWSRRLALEMSGERVTIDVALSAKGENGAAAEVRVPVSLAVRDVWERHTRTFISGIDRSVQYYAVVPPPREAFARDARPEALVLSLHGASVEATSQAASYRQRDWCVVICPTNRRPFGFDWEDWGRIDALEVLADAERTWRTDPSRRFLTGHSMGGHGTWHLGVTHPGLFAAIAPSAGWGWFDDYGGRRPGAEEAGADALLGIFRRSASTSDTPALVENLRGTPVFILHGDADDNVPLALARQMRDRLDAAGIASVLQVRAGGGHWWDDPQTPGADCVDWPAMFDLFRDSRLSTPTSVRFMHPAMLALPAGLAPAGAHAGVTGALQQQAGVRSELLTARDGSISTINLRVLSIARAGEATIDGTSLTLTGGTHLRAAGTPATWTIARGERPGAAETNAPTQKWGRDAGLFKYALMDGFALLASERGGEADDAAALATARYLGERWWYQGNGYARFVREPLEQRERRVLVVGVATADGGEPAPPAWMPDAPLRVSGAGATLGEHTFTGRHAVLITHPGPNTRAAILATDADILRLTALLPIFTSGVGYADVTVLSEDFLQRGFEGVRAAGFFGPTWGLDGAELVVRPIATRNNSASEPAPPAPASPGAK